MSWKKGFSLLELMVAMVCAAIFTGSVLKTQDLFHKHTRCLAINNELRSKATLERMRQSRVQILKNREGEFVLNRFVEVEQFP